MVPVESQGRYLIESASVQATVKTQGWLVGVQDPPLKAGTATPHR